MLPNPFFLALMTASASAHFMQVTSWSGKNCHGSSEIGCKSNAFRSNQAQKMSVSETQQQQLTTHIPKDIDHKTSHCFPIPGGSFNGLHWDFISHGGMHCKMTTW